MTKSSKKHPNTEDEAMTAAMRGIMAFNPMSAVALNMWFDMGKEAMRFVSLRMQQDLETQKAILACKSVEEIQKVQAEFYGKALEEYRAQMSRMMEIISTVTTDDLADLPMTTKRGYDDVPL